MVLIFDLDWNVYPIGNSYAGQLPAAKNIQDIRELLHKLMINYILEIEQCQNIRIKSLRPDLPASLTSSFSTLEWTKPSNIASWEHLR